MTLRRATIILIICWSWQWNGMTLAQVDDECEDQLGHCNLFKTYCEHEIHGQYAKDNCPVTCKVCPKDIDPLGLCSGPDNGGCEQTCEVLEKKTKKCTCFIGYKLQDDGVSCEDIDECQFETCPPNHYCSNTPGGYVCDKAQCSDQPGKMAYMGRAECCQKEADDAECGVRQKGVERIVGGKTSYLGQWPWQVLIVIDKSVLCGGTLISKDWVVTAGHCFKGFKEDTSFELFFGIIKYNARNVKHVQKRKLKKHILYPNWKEENFEINDIALVELNRPVRINNYVKPVCLPNGEKPKVGTPCFAAGWGLTEEEGQSASPDLQHVDLPIVDRDKCEYNYQNETIKVDKSIMMCAGYDEGGKDACRGDSGGPLVCQRCDSCGWYLAGVVSFGSGCGRAGLYGVYADVPHYEDWIASQTSIHVTKDRSCTGPYFTQWANWSKCTKSCGSGGQHTRKRECIHKGLPSSKCDGPKTETANCPVKKCPSFGDWGEWTECSVTCGGGEQYQVRECKNGKIGDDGCPDKEATRSRKCNTQNCPKWDKWGDWGKCSVTCGGGTRKRKRVCIGGKPSDVGCEGSEEESTPCNTDLCPGWSEWEGWTKCSKSCGGGVQENNRRCIGKGSCPGDSVRDRQCNTQSCPVFGKWQAWTSCDVTCGGGNRHRNRPCENGKIGDAGCEKGRESQSQRCNTQQCPVFSSWSEWSDCSASCGGGKQESSRQCLNGRVGDKGCEGPIKRSQDCAENECIGTFGDWGDWSTCSKTCGQGTQTRSRPCVGGTKCNGKSDETRNCELKKCPVFGDWSDWGKCSVSCAGGHQSRSRKCLHTTNPNDCDGDSSQRRPCNTMICPGKWTNWSKWSRCDVTCGEGTSERSRECEGGEVGNPGCDDGPAKETRKCNEKDCPSRWGNWDSWSTCSKSCDRGIQTRTRPCDGGKPGTGGCVPASDASEEKACNEVICADCSDYTEQYCNTYFPTPTECEQYPSFAETYCPVKCKICPILHEHWNDWGSCSSTCGKGTRQRRRECKAVGTARCEGTDIEEEECEASCRGFSPWSDWSKCTASCNGGKHTRSRTCPFARCDPDEKGNSELSEVEDCNVNPCPGIWDKWGKWGACSVTCGDDGLEERKRECIGGSPGGPGCRGRDTETSPCRDMPSCPGKWTQWSKWSDCSVTCGTGQRTKERRCENGIPGQSGCEGSARQSEDCDAGNCVAKWDKWGDWGECDDSCSRSRSRTCNGGQQGDPGCTGEGSETEACDASLCDGGSDLCDGALIDLELWCSTIQPTACRRLDIQSRCPTTCCNALESLPCEDDPQYAATCQQSRSFCNDPQYEASFFRPYCSKTCGFC